MNESIQSILNDLFELDPELKKMEKNLIPLLEKLVAAKPDLRLDDRFVSELRGQLMERADELRLSQTSTRVSWFARYLKPLMGGSLALAALFIGLMVWRGSVEGPINPIVSPEAAPMMAKSLPVPEPENAEPTVGEPERIMADRSIPTLRNENPIEPQSEPIPETEESMVAAPMMLQALPAEGNVGIDVPKTTNDLESATPPTESGNVGAARMMEPKSADQQIADRDATIRAAWAKVQAGELKISADSAQTGVRSPKDILAIDLNSLPDGFVEIASALPEGYRAFEDLMPTWSDGLPQYYIYSTIDKAWYGPF